MRIAIHDKDRCKPSLCNFLCMRMCPVNRTGGECIVEDEDSGKVSISELLCTGCGICVKRCPFDAIKIINLPQELENPVHQYGMNGFRLFNLPLPRQGVIGIVGSNGIGKTTALKILAGEVVPNLSADGGWDAVLERYRTTEMHDYLKRLSEGQVKVSFKPQYVESIPKVVSGKVADILGKTDERGMLDHYVQTLDLTNTLEKDITSISGGELQRVAVTACLLREADIYLIDEPSSYLDVRERLNVCRTIREISDKTIFVVEHDLVVLDYLSDNIHVIFGEKGGYGIISNIMGTRAGINEYLSGFLKSENMRFREGIKFDIRPPSSARKTRTIFEYPKLKKTYEGFSLEIDAGKIETPSIVGVLGPNATGKTTFIKMLAGIEIPDDGKVDADVQVSYKPQYIKATEEKVQDLGITPDLVTRFRLDHLMQKKLTELSGGELQIVAICDCLAKDADIYMLDEPSAYLDVEERLFLAKYLNGFGYDKKVSVIVIEHDILLVDYLSEMLMVFYGEGGKNGRASHQMEMRPGMNKFLSQMNVTFRREPETGRPRANKPGSVKDREQRSKGEFYYG